MVCYSKWALYRRALASSLDLQSVRFRSYFSDPGFDGGEAVVGKVNTMLLR